MHESVGSNHEAAVALHYMHYNFCRIHQTLRCTPAMEAGLSDHVWSLEEVVDLLDNATTGIGERTQKTDRKRDINSAQGVYLNGE